MNTVLIPSRIEINRSFNFKQTMKQKSAPHLHFFCSQPPSLPHTRFTLLTQPLPSPVLDKSLSYHPFLANPSSLEHLTPSSFTKSTFHKWYLINLPLSQPENGGVSLEKKYFYAVHFVAGMNTLFNSSRRSSPLCRNICLLHCIAQCQSKHIILTYEWACSLLLPKIKHYTTPPVFFTYGHPELQLLQPL